VLPCNISGIFDDYNSPKTLNALRESDKVELTIKKDMLESPLSVPTIL
jgi:hypothetical protein